MHKIFKYGRQGGEHFVPGFLLFAFMYLYFELLPKYAMTLVFDPIGYYQINSEEAGLDLFLLPLCFSHVATILHRILGKIY